MGNAVTKILSEAKQQGRTALTEVESKEVLKAYNIPVRTGQVAADPDTAATIADKVGYPVVMKLVSPDISHKSDVGGVRVKLDSPEAVRSAFTDIIQNAKFHRPDANIHGVLIYRMVPEGVELVIGATFSRQFGHAVMFGLGGIFVEVTSDVVFRMVPLTKEESLDMIQEIRGRKILGNFRGKPAVDVNAVADIIQKLSALLTDHPEILEVDMNPVIASESGAIVVDARMAIGEPKKIADTVYTSDEIVTGMKRIFSPAGIAIIGASSDPSKLGYSTVKNIIDGGYKGKIYPINPKTDEILGLKCYRSVQEIPDKVDVAVIVIPAKNVADAITALGEKGVAGAIVISSGFAEIGNNDLQRELVTKAFESKVRILGPNIFGLYYTPADLCATFCTPYTEKGPTALSCQSGGVGMAIIGYSRSHRMGVSSIVGVGNKCDVDEDDLIEFFGQDPNTKVIAMHVEDIKDGVAFVRAAQKVSRQKPIVALKAGATALGERAAFSHTGALAGDDRIYSAAFAKAGIVRVSNLEELLDCARSLSKMPTPKGENILIVTGAGGLGVLLADACSRHQLQLMTLEKDLDEAFKKFIPPFGATGNPVDITGGEPPETYEATIRLALEDDRVDALILGYWHTLITPPMVFAETLIRAKQAVETVKAPKPIVAALSGDVEVERAATLLEAHGVPAFPYSSEKAVIVLSALYRWARMAGKIKPRP
ncbi:MAG: acetate--CoA ligase family protein [Deltaproteobacteria bacterium]|nr:acetate--CoA ligase family protein [Deltaproteobacteria bacterium]